MVAIVPAEFGDESGMLGAALLALDSGVVSGRLVVCPTPIGNLEDVTLRVLSALREADVVACEDTRRTRVLLDRYGVSARLVSYHEHNEQARAAELVGRMRDGRRSSRSCRTRACRSCRTRATCWCARAWRRGCRWRCCRAVGGDDGAGGVGAAGREWRFRGFLPRKKGELGRAVRARAGTLVAFESPRRVPRDAGGAGVVEPDARGGGLPRADEGARGGGARDGGELAERYAERRRAARWCWWWGRPPRRRALARPPRRRTCCPSLPTPRNQRSSCDNNTR